MPWWSGVSLKKNINQEVRRRVVVVESRPIGTIVIYCETAHTLERPDLSRPSNGVNGDIYCVIALKLK